MAIKTVKTKDTIKAAEKEYFKNGRRMKQVVYLTPFGRRPDGTTRYKSVTRHEAANA